MRSAVPRALTPAPSQPRSPPSHQDRLPGSCSASGTSPRERVELGEPPACPLPAPPGAIPEPGDPAPNLLPAQGRFGAWLGVPSLSGPRPAAGTCWWQEAQRCHPCWTPGEPRESVRGWSSPMGKCWVAGQVDTRCLAGQTAAGTWPLLAPDQQQPGAEPSGTGQAHGARFGARQVPGRGFRAAGLSPGLGPEQGGLGIASPRGTGWGGCRVLGAGCCLTCAWASAPRAGAGSRAAAADTAPS